jgi:hypothetical protein
MKTLRLLAAATLAFAAFATVAFAEGTVTIPTGEVVTGAVDIINTVGAWAISVLLAYVSHRWLGAYLSKEMTARVEQLLVRAWQSGVNKAALGIPPNLEVSVQSPELAHAVEYAMTWGAKAILKWAGGVKGIEEKLIARMEVLIPTDSPQQG